MDGAGLGRKHAGMGRGWVRDGGLTCCRVGMAMRLFPRITFYIYVCNFSVIDMHKLANCSDYVYYFIVS